MQGGRSHKATHDSKLAQEHSFFSSPRIRPLRGAGIAAPSLNSNSHSRTSAVSMSQGTGLVTPEWLSDRYLPWHALRMLASRLYSCLYRLEAVFNKCLLVVAQVDKGCFIRRLKNSEIKVVDATWYMPNAGMPFCSQS